MTRPANPISSSLMGAPRGLIVILAMSMVSSAIAQPRVFLDRKLNETYGELVSMDAESITIRSDGLAERTARDRWLAMLTPGKLWGGVSEKKVMIGRSGAATGVNQRIVLVDGQRLFGRLVEEPSPTPESILWRIPGLAEIEVSLEQIVSLELISSSRAPASFDPSTGDAVIALNGDLLRGFVERIGETLVLDTGSAKIELELPLVREVYLSNPRRPSPVPLAWLADGSVIGFGDGTIDDSGQLVAMLALDGLGSADRPTPGHSIAIPTRQTRAVLFDPRRLVGLCEIEPTRLDVIEGRLWAPGLRVGDVDGAQLGAAPITISGPIRCEWALPTGAVRVAGLATIPDDSRLWGDFELVLGVRTSGGKTHELFRERLNAQRPGIPFNISFDRMDTPAISLILRLESGEYGPIQDEVVLERAVILIDP